MMMLNQLFCLLFHSFLMFQDLFFYILSSEYFVLLKVNVGFVEFAFIPSVKLTHFSINLGCCGICGGLAQCASYNVLLGAIHGGITLLSTCVNGANFALEMSFLGCGITTTMRHHHSHLFVPTDGVSLELIKIFWFLLWLFPGNQT